MNKAIKPANLLAAIMGNPQANAGPGVATKNMDFDEAFYNKFEKLDEKGKDNETDSPNNKRRRKNPLGDFKFKRINELF